MRRLTQTIRLSSRSTAELRDEVLDHAARRQAVRTASCSMLDRISFAT